MNYVGKIKKCPFCGGEAWLTQEPLWQGDRGYRGEYHIYVKCQSEGCGVSLPNGKFATLYNTKDKCEKLAIEKWNNRSK